MFPRRTPIQRRGSRLMVWRGFPRPHHRKRRNLRRRRPHRRTPDPATAQLCAGDEPEQRPLAHRPRQRPRALSRQPHHRRLDAGGASSWLHQSRPRLGARSICWARPIEGSDDRVLASTLRENAPAPAPWDVRLAATPLVPAFPSQPPPVRNERLASAMPSATTSDASPYPGPAQAMSFADPPAVADGTDQFLNGRGLY